MSSQVSVVEAGAAYLDWAASVGWSILPVRPNKIPAGGHSWGQQSYIPESWVLKDGTLAGIGLQFGVKSGWTFEIDMDTDDEDDLKAVMDIWEEAGMIVVGKRWRDGSFQPSRLIGRFSEPPSEEWLCGAGRAGKMTASFVEVDFGGSVSRKKRRDGKKIAQLEFRFGGFLADGITPMQMFSLILGRNGEAVVEFRDDPPGEYNEVPLVDFDLVLSLWEKTLAQLNMEITFAESKKRGNVDLDAMAVRKQQDGYWLDFCDVATRLFFEEYRLGGGNKCMFCPKHNRSAMCVWADNRAACYHDGGSCALGVVPRGGQQVGVREVVGKAMKLNFPKPQDRKNWEFEGVPFMQSCWSDNDYEAVENALSLEAFGYQPLEVSIERFLAGKKIMTDEVITSLAAGGCDE